MRRLFTSYLPSIALGTFLARFCYELDPLRLAVLGDWLGVIALNVVSLLVTHYLSRITHHASRITLTPLFLLFVYIFWPEVDLRWALLLLIGALALVGQNMVMSYKPRLFDLGLTASVLALYLLTLGTRVGRADSFEFQVVMPQLGIAHPTGYPLFILIGKLFSLLPLGSMAFRVNLFSALAATIAVMLVYRLIVRLTSDRQAAALAAFTLAASSVFWSQAVVIEVYTLNALFVAIILTVLIQLMGNRSIGNWLIGNRSTSYLSPVTNHQSTNLPIYFLALVFGLALSHHLTSVILIPPIAITILLIWPKLPLKSWLIALGLFVLGLTPWLIIPLRWPGLHNGALMSMGEWTGWIFGQRFGGALNFSLWTDPMRWAIITRIVLDQFGIIGAMLAAMGLLVLIKRTWRVALITVAAFAGYWFYGLVYNVPDVNVFIIPVFLIMAVWLGFGMHWIASLIESANLIGRSLVTHHSSLVTYYALLALLPLSLIATNYVAVDQHERDADLEEWGRYVLSLPIPAKAAILADSEKIAPLYYLQVTEGLRPDLDILVLGDEAQYRQELDQRLAAGQAVYLARFLPNLPYRMRSLGPLVEVSTQSLMSAPAIEYETTASFGNSINLLGVTEEQGDPFRITLFWQATSSERANYHVRLRLRDIGNVWWEDPGAHPVGGYYSTGAWAQGEIVPDFHEIKIEPYMPAGMYDLEIGLFTPFQSNGLMVNGTNWLKVAEVNVTPPPPGSLAHEMRAVLGRTVVTSVNELGIVPPNSKTIVRFNTTETPHSSELRVVSSDDAVVLDIGAVTGPGQTRVTFDAPLQSGTYKFHLQMGNPARCHWLTPLTPDCVIGAFEVGGEASLNAINFDRHVLLLNAAFDRDKMKPGETIKVNITWQSISSAWEADYTVFVHLIGPDGLVRGQVDQWPMQGTLPTSGWHFGQTVKDSYTITLPPDAPRGKYQIEVGWYLLATLRRLSVLDAAGRPSDDKVIIGEFVVP